MSLCGHIVLCFLICKVEIAAVRAQGGRGPVMCLPNFSPLSASSRVGLWPRATCTVLIHRLRNRVIEQRYLTILSTTDFRKTHLNLLPKEILYVVRTSGKLMSLTTNGQRRAHTKTAPRELFLRVRRKSSRLRAAGWGGGSSCVFRSAWTDGWTGERTDRRIDRHRALCKSGA